MDTSDAKRLEKIDQLYRLRLDRHVSLPQLIVVGDQSSGKSSVLEALTNGLPFPRDSGLCTRFPTQIVFKRSPTTKIEVSVIPAEGNLTALKFKKRELSGLDADQLVKIISEACVSMGLPEPGKPSEGHKSFSQDLLKIELSAPHHEHFSVIDLPGLFRKTTLGQTTSGDIGLVREMITSYMKNARSIILAVVPANVDIATQEIVHMAEEADPERKRTLGVLTKPDLVDAGAEDKVLQLLRPNSSSLGFAVVCNRSQKLLWTSTASRDAHEKTFFNTEPWNQVSRDRAGISALKDLFKKLLKGITRKSFDDVVREIEIKLDANLREKEKMGPARHTSTAQRVYLLQLVTDYQMLINDAIQSSYSRGTCFTSKEMRLTSLAIATGEEFAESIMIRGFKRPFLGDSDVDDKEKNGSQSPHAAKALKEVHKPKSPSMTVLGGSSGITSSPESRYNLRAVSGATPNVDDRIKNDNSGPPAAKKIKVTSKQNGKGTNEDVGSEFPELRFLPFLHSSKPQYSEENILNWLQREHQSYRSLGIGGLNPSLYQTLFKVQTGPWIPISQDYLAQTIISIHRFLYELLKHVCKDLNVAEAIWSRITPQLKECYTRASDHLKFVLEVEREGNLGTLNHYFAANVAKSNEERTMSRLKDTRAWYGQANDGHPLLRLQDVTKFTQSNEEYQVEQIHDTLKSYCKVACKRFVDNVYMQVVDHLLIASDKSPLKVLCSAWVGSLSDTDLAEIAGETESVKHRRKVLKEEIESFEAGLAILRA